MFIHLLFIIMFDFIINNNLQSFNLGLSPKNELKNHWSKKKKSLCGLVLTKIKISWYNL